MTAILAAGLVLSWVAIALLALGYAGLLGRLRDLQAGRPGTQQVNPELAAPGPDRKTLVLALSSNCGTCESVFEPWQELAPKLSAAGHRTVLIAVDGSDKWAQRGAYGTLDAERLSSPLLIAYQPALLVFDDSGVLLSADPIGSAEGLRAQCDAFLESESSLS